MRSAVTIVVAMLATCRGEPPAPAVPTGPTILLSIDDGAPRTIEVPGTIALATMIEVPPTAWLAVHADATDDRGLEIVTPTTRYPGSELRLYLDQGQPALGVFPPVTPDMPSDIAALARQPTASLTLLATVRVLTRPVTRPGLVVVVDGREVALDSEQLRTLPGQEGARSRAQGWPLAAVVDLAAPGRELRVIRIVGAGNPLTLDAHALRGPGQSVVMKQNQRGEYVVRVWAPEGRSPTREIRRVTQIVLD